MRAYRPSAMCEEDVSDEEAWQEEGREERVQTYRHRAELHQPLFDPPQKEPGRALANVVGIELRPLSAPLAAGQHLSPEGATASGTFGARMANLSPGGIA